MEKLKTEQMEMISAGNRATAIIGGIACAASLVSPISALIFGPTCMGMIIATIYD